MKYCVQQMKLPPMLGPQVFNLPVSVTLQPDTGCVVLNITGKWYEEILRGYSFLRFRIPLTRLYLDQSSNHIVCFQHLQILKYVQFVSNIFPDEFSVFKLFKQTIIIIACCLSTYALKGYLFLRPAPVSALYWTDSDKTLFFSTLRQSWK